MRKSYMVSGIKNMETAYRESKIELKELSWEDVMVLSSNVANKVISSAIKIDTIVGISRGGIIPARIISDMLLVKDFYVYGVNFYTGINERDEIKIIQRPDGNFKNKNVLIVDDIIDSGKTMIFVRDKMAFEAGSVKTASLLKKPWSDLEPDFYASVTDKWIVFPWETTETKVELANKKIGDGIGKSPSRDNWSA